MAGVEVRGLYKRFHRTEVLRGIDLEIADGEFVVLVGPSGCGKSTLLRLIAGLEDEDAGRISIGGHDVGQLPPAQRDVAMVFQNYALYPHMTVAENMSFGLRLARVDATVIARKVAAAAEILGLTDLLARYPKQLSGGQKQRVAMGRAIVREPKVFLFDEPLSNLDAKLRVQMRKEIKTLHRRLGITSIYVTHDQVEAMTLADRVVVLNEGRIEQAGPGLELYDHPVNTFVAGFIGSPAINLVAGCLRRADQGSVFVPDGADITIEVHAASGAATPEEAFLGVRPEDLVLAERGAIEGVVKVVEQTGAETIAFIEAIGAELCVLFRQRVNVRPDDTVRLDADPRSMHLFRRSDGARIAQRLLA